MATSTTVNQPKQKPLLKARFSELVALNFSIDPSILEPLVPKGLELDFFKDETYVSLVAMMLRDVRVFGFPIHIASGFEEFNLRFYVRRKVGDTYRKGDLFFKGLCFRSRSCLDFRKNFQGGIWKTET